MSSGIKLVTNLHIWLLLFLFGCREVFSAATDETYYSQYYPTDHYINCSLMEDIETKALFSPIVLEAVIEARILWRPTLQHQNISIKIKKIFDKSLPIQESFLHFVGEFGQNHTYGYPCEQYNENRRSSKGFHESSTGISATEYPEIQTTKRYFFFLSRTPEPIFFRPLFYPMPVSKPLRERIERVLCAGCGMLCIDFNWLFYLENAEAMEDGISPQF